MLVTPGFSLRLSCWSRTTKKARGVFPTTDLYRLQMSLTEYSCRVPAPFQLYSQRLFQLLGHLCRHVDTLEYQVTFMGSHAY